MAVNTQRMDVPQKPVCKCPLRQHAGKHRIFLSPSDMLFLKYGVPSNVSTNSSLKEGFSAMVANA